MENNSYNLKTSSLNVPFTTIFENIPFLM